MNDLKFFIGQQTNWASLSKDPNSFYLVINNDNTIDSYLGDIQLSKGSIISEFAAEIVRAKAAEQANADAIAAEVSRATTKEAELESAIGVNTRDITTLNGEADVQGSVKNIVVQAVSEVVAEAPEAFDTLKEIADYIASDKTGAAEMSNAIAANKKAIEDEVARALEAENSLRTDLNSEIERATLKETELDSAIKDEVDRATAVEETLDTKIDGEVSRATAKEAELEGLISTEATTARAAEKANADAIAAEKERAEGVEAQLSEDLTNEIAQRKGLKGDGNISVSIDAETSLQTIKLVWQTF